MSSLSDAHREKLDELSARGIRVVGPTYAEDAAARESSAGVWSVVAHLPAGIDGDATVDGHGATADAALEDLLARLDTGPGPA